VVRPGHGGGSLISTPFQDGKQVVDEMEIGLLRLTLIYNVGPQHEVFFNRQAFEQFPVG
jgi:hypothetical protein